MDLHLELARQGRSHGPNVAVSREAGLLSCISSSRAASGLPPRPRAHGSVFLPRPVQRIRGPQSAVPRHDGVPRDDGVQRGGVGHCDVEHCGTGLCGAEDAAA